VCKGPDNGGPKTVTNGNQQWPVTPKVKKKLDYTENYAHDWKHAAKNKE
jgi:hypothetical protein